ncbi:hypothetical protein FA15DRAFT_611037 [Coprinopsis marcescibilis]|uniref:SnoaL-like domain-containing protein n=1 Tax=Coprinopsis marcescibilis TaxID=230819 RepID=A0A5C3LA97_COPMA|nr:hypothetical protein FA15DRAFT_611037 [Coprinopsis marcescibilis]
MRFFTTALTLLSCASIAMCTPTLTPATVCDPNASGPLLAARQKASIKDFANIFLVEKDVQKAFDKYIPGDFVQHDPWTLSGRQNAIDVLIPIWPTVSFSNIHAYAGEGYGTLHVKRTSGSDNYAFVSKLKFQGTCFVEHWSVEQQIFGTEPNPIAFF